MLLRGLTLLQAKPTELKAALEAGGGFVWELSLPKNAEGELSCGCSNSLTTIH